MEQGVRRSANDLLKYLLIIYTVGHVPGYVLAASQPNVSTSSSVRCEYSNDTSMYHKNVINSLLGSKASRSRSSSSK